MRIAHRFSGEPPGTSMEENESHKRLYQALVGRLQSLEASHARLREQVDELVQGRKHNNKKKEEEEEAGSDSWLGVFPGCFVARGPYRSVLEHMGHAVHVCRASSGEIIYWNRSAAKLYGWKEYEVLGRQVAQLLVTEECYAPLQKIMDRLSTGQSWSGQYPFKKKSGEIFMAIVTKSPLYEDGEFAGFVTVSSDAALLKSIDSENLRTHKDQADQPRVQSLNLKRIQWYPRPPIAPVPQIASSFSNLASKVLLRRHEDDRCNACDTSLDKEDTAIDTEDPRLEKPSTLAAKVLAKLHIKGVGNCGKEDYGSIQDDGASDSSANKVIRNAYYSRDSKASTSYDLTFDTEDKGDEPRRTESSFATRRAYSKMYKNRTPDDFADTSVEASSKECTECCRLASHVDAEELEPEETNLKVLEIEDAMQRQKEGKQLQSPGESIGSQGNSSSKGDDDSNSIVDYDIRWEHLHVAEEIGRGYYATVHRGVWNGSDVAIKVYFGNEYSETTLQDYKKEIDIMRRLRHPNVLLFMGAVYTQERLAIVTEFLPRGSLFRSLHKNKRALDIRRRLGMALDVARGMNYLHHRNPPIVHRDLKSSNVLVDKNWTVKVGDFGLSKLKNSTFITAKSGRGTPQWMAPEILRNEPSNEKSDVFSFGVILWELMTESIPWDNLNSLEVVGVVGFMDRRLDLPEGLDPQVASIIHDCWQSDPKQRPSFEDVIQRMKALLHGAAAVSTPDGHRALESQYVLR